MNAQDAQLLPRLLAGEEAAYRLLVSIHHAAMTRLARAIIGDAFAEEVVQEAWIKAIAALPSFEGRSSLRLWLLRILRNEAVSRLRKERRAPDTERLAEDEGDDRYGPDGSWRTPPTAWSLDTPEALLAAQELRAVIEETLENMPVMQRAVLALRDVEGLPFEDICNILELSASNARVLLHRARQRLWAAIDDYEKE
jgi:RNA polymerase sigma-70 factor (ECF subfamily)